MNFDEAAAALGYNDREELEAFDDGHALHHAGDTAQDRAVIHITAAIADRALRGRATGLAEMVALTDALPRDGWTEEFDDDDPDTETWALLLDRKPTLIFIFNPNAHTGRSDWWAVSDSGSVKPNAAHLRQEDAEDEAYDLATGWRKALAEAMAGPVSTSTGKRRVTPRGDQESQRTPATTQRRITIAKRNPKKKKR